MTTEEELLTVKRLERITGRDERSIWRDNDAGRLPAPVRICRSVRWRKSDILRWIELGCPSRKEFEARKEAKDGSDTNIR